MNPTLDHDITQGFRNKLQSPLQYNLYGKQKSKTAEVEWKEREENLFSQALRIAT